MSMSFSLPNIPETHGPSLAQTMLRDDFHALYRTNEWSDIASGPQSDGWSWANDRLKSIFPEHKLSSNIFIIVQQLNCVDGLKHDIYYASALSYILPQHIKYESNEDNKEIIAQDLDDVNDFLEDMEENYGTIGLVYRGEEQHNDFLIELLEVPDFT